MAFGWHTVIVLLLTAGYLWVFWLLYVLVMGLYRSHLDGRLKGLSLVLALPILAVAYLVDLFANWTIASAVFLELPNRPLELVTDRLSRHIYDKGGWRRTLSEWVCNNLLDLFDPTGKHCK